MIKTTVPVNNGGNCVTMVEVEMTEEQYAAKLAAEAGEVAVETTEEVIEELPPEPVIDDKKKK